MAQRRTRARKAAGKRARPRAAPQRKGMGKAGKKANPAARKPAARVKPARQRPRLRPLTAADLAAVIALDAAIVGRSRRGYFEKRLAAALRDPDRHIQFAVDLGPRLIGFVLARVRDEEFGRPGMVVDFESIGIEPRYRRHGIGTMLIDGLKAAMRHRGIEELATEARWTNHTLLAFLEREGFALAPRLILDRAIADPPIL